MTTVPVPRETLGDSSWFTHDRFGMFIHWGLYAMGARHEWQQQVEAIPPDDYAARYFPRFDPDLYDPGVWADAAAGAGMRYLVVVTKHQEGFCLWDTAFTDFKATNTPAARDLLRPMLDAYRERGMRTGLYYSLLDWHHPDFTVDFMHPLNAKGDRDDLNKGRDMDRYRDFIKSQITELLTEYGPIDIMWPDFSYTPTDLAAMATSESFGELVGAAEADLGAGAAVPNMASGKGAADWNAEALLDMIRALQPRILLNDRLGLRSGWDIKTPEQIVPARWPTVNGELVVWELCQTFAGRWGYNRDDTTWKSVEQLVIMLIDVVSMGGNLLLNVGPNGRGEFDPRVLDRLEGIGSWMRQHSRSIYGCTQPPDDLRSAIPGDMRATYNPMTNRLYLHLLRWPAQSLVVPGLRDRVDYAQLLHDGSELLRPSSPADGLELMHAPDERALWLKVPAVRPDVTVPVIELFLKP